MAYVSRVIRAAPLSAQVFTSTASKIHHRTYTATQKVFKCKYAGDSLLPTVPLSRFSTAVIQERSQNSKSFMKEASSPSSLEQLEDAVNRNRSITYRDVVNVLKAFEAKQIELNEEERELLLKTSSKIIPVIPLADKIAITQRAWNAITSQGGPITTLVMNGYLRAMLNNKMDFNVPDFLETMMKYNASPDEVTYSLCVEKYCRDGDLLSANAVLQQMKEENNSLPTSVLQVLLESLVSIGDEEGTSTVKRRLLLSGRCPESYVNTSLLRGYTSAGNISAIDELLSSAIMPVSFPKWSFEVCVHLVESGHSSSLPQLIEILQNNLYLEDSLANIHFVYYLASENYFSEAVTLFKAFDRKKNPELSAETVVTLFLKRGAPFAELEALIDFIISSQSLTSLDFLCKKNWIHLPPTSISNVVEIMATKDLDCNNKRLLEVLFGQFQVSTSAEDVYSFVAKVKSHLDKLPAIKGSYLCRMAVKKLYQKEETHDQILLRMMGVGFSRYLVESLQLAFVFNSGNYSMADGIRSRWHMLDEHLLQRINQGLSGKKDVDACLEALDKVFRITDRDNSISAMTSVLQLVCQNTTLRNHDPNAPAKVVSFMKQKNIFLKDAAVSSILQMADELKLEDETVKLLTRPADEKILIEYCRQGKVEEAEKLKEKLSEAGQLSDKKVLFNLMQLAVTKKKDLSEALMYKQQLNQMHPDFILKNTSLLNLLELMVDENKIEEALSTLEEHVQNQQPEIEESYQFFYQVWNILQKTENEHVPLFIKLLSANHLGPLNTDRPGILKSFDEEKLLVILKSVPHNVHLYKRYYPYILAALSEKDGTDGLEKGMELVRNYIGESNASGMLIEGLLKIGRHSKAVSLLQDCGDKGPSMYLCETLQRSNRVDLLSTLAKSSDKLPLKLREEFLFAAVKACYASKQFEKLAKLASTFNECGITPTKQMRDFITNRIASNSGQKAELLKSFLGSFKKLSDSDKSGVLADTEKAIDEKDWSSVVQILERLASEKQAFTKILGKELLSKLSDCYGDLDGKPLEEIESLLKIRKFFDKTTMEVLFEQYVIKGKVEDLLAQVESGKKNLTRDVHLSLKGLTLLQERQPELIQRVEDLAREKKSGHTRAQNDLRWFYVCSNQEDKAQQLIKDFPLLKDFRPPNHMYIYLLEQKNEEMLESLCQMIPNNPHVLSYTMRVKDKLGKKDEVLSLYNSLITMGSSRRVIEKQQSLFSYLPTHVQLSDVAAADDDTNTSNQSTESKDPDSSDSDSSDSDSSDSDSSDSDSNEHGDSKVNKNE